MNNSSSPTVPSIHVHGADDSSVLFDGGEFLNFLEDTGLYQCSQGFHSDYFRSDPVLAELEDIHLSHLPVTSQPFLTGYAISSPYPAPQENVPADTRPSLTIPLPSPTLSFSSSLSPSSCGDPLALSDCDSLLSPPPVTPDVQLRWPLSLPLNHHSSESPATCYISSAPLPPAQSTIGPHRTRAKSSSPRPGPVASKAMLEANGRRRRHPPQFECVECKQTFTALFSLKRHQQSHSGERLFACSIPGCTQRFYNSSDCKRHEKSKKRHRDL